MTLIEALAIIGAGMAAGLLNTVVGSGSLITFPTLVFFGFPPLVANVSNTVGLVPGSASGVYGYRRELTGQRQRAIRLGIAAVCGALVGAGLLLALPSSTFSKVVPFLVLGAAALMATQPLLSRFVQRHRPHGAEESKGLVVVTFLTAIYGGYFGAAQSVLFMAFLGVFVPDTMQRLNGMKNLLALFVNVVAAAVFVVVAPVDWRAAGLIALGSIIGGQVGAHVGRRLPPQALRAAAVAVAVLVAVRLLFFS